MITLKEFANIENISYEAVRQQVNRYKKDLAQHLVKEGRTTYLDDWAVEYLKSKRSKQPVIVQQRDQSAELEQLRNENKQLLVELARVQQSEIEKTEKIVELQQLLLSAPAESRDEVEALKLQLAEMKSFSGWLRHRKE